MDCSGQCKTVATDNQNCGACGNACGAGRICSNGTCQCATGLMNCNGQCVGVRRARTAARAARCARADRSAATTPAWRCARRDRPCARGARASRRPATARSPTAAAATPARPAPTPATTASAAARSPAEMLCGSACVDTQHQQHATAVAATSPAPAAPARTGSCMATTGTGGTTGAGGSTGGTGGSAGGVSGSVGTAARRHGGTTGTGGVSGTTGTGGGAAARPAAAAPAARQRQPGRAGGPPARMHGCPWTGIDTVVGHHDGEHAARTFTTKTDSFATPYCVSGTVAPGLRVGRAARLQPQRDADGTRGPVRVQAGRRDRARPARRSRVDRHRGIAINFSKKVGSVLRIQIQDADGRPDHRRRHAPLVLHDHRRPGPGVRAVQQVQHQVLGSDGHATSTRRRTPISAVVFAVPGVLVPSRYDYCIGGFAFGSDVSRRARLQPQPVPGGGRDASAAPARRISTSSASR